MKACSRCGESKPAEDFAPRKNRCRACEGEYKLKFQTNRKLRLERDSKWRRSAAGHAYERKHRIAREERRLERYRFSKYGLTRPAFFALKKKQRSRCPICLTSFDHGDRRRRVSVDHCHATGTVRGLLCTSCNTALGLLNDSPDSLRRAIEYLRRNTLKLEEVAR